MNDPNRYLHSLAGCGPAHPFDGFGHAHRRQARDDRDGRIGHGSGRGAAPIPGARQGSYLEHPMAQGLFSAYSEAMKKTILSHVSPPASARAARPLMPIFACFGVLALFAGCTTEPDSHVVSAPPPPTPTSLVTTTMTTTTPVAVVTPAVVVGNTAYATQTPVVSTTVVTQAPPTLQQEVVLAQPSPQHVWIAGYWTWRNEQYQWMAGNWVLPPNSGSVWVAPRWEKQGNAYKFSEGYWN